MATPTAPTPSSCPRRRLARHPLADEGAGRRQRGPVRGDFLVGTFSLDPPEGDGLYSAALDHDGEVEEIVGGLTGMEVVSRGPDGDIYVPATGPDQPATGSVQRFSESGELQPFVERVDAVHVAFDAESVLGGGMFLTDFANKSGSGRVFEIRPE